MWIDRDDGAATQGPRCAKHHIRSPRWGRLGPGRIMRAATSTLAAPSPPLSPAARRAIVPRRARVHGRQQVIRLHPEWLDPSRVPDDDHRGRSRRPPPASVRLPAPPPGVPAQLRRWRRQDDAGRRAGDLPRQPRRVPKRGRRARIRSRSCSSTRRGLLRRSGCGSASRRRSCRRPGAGLDRARRRPRRSRAKPARRRPHHCYRRIRSCLPRALHGRGRREIEFRAPEANSLLEAARHRRYQLVMADLGSRPRGRPPRPAQGGCRRGRGRAPDRRVAARPVPAQRVACATSGSPESWPSSPTNATTTPRCGASPATSARRWWAPSRQQSAGFVAAANAAKRGWRLDPQLAAALLPVAGALWPMDSLAAAEAALPGWHLRPARRPACGGRADGTGDPRARAVSGDPAARCAACSSSV